MLAVHVGVWLLQGCLMSLILFMAFMDRISSFLWMMWFRWLHKVVTSSSLEWFVVDCESAGMRTGTSKCEAITLRKGWSAHSGSRTRCCPKWRCLNITGGLEISLNPTDYTLISCGSDRQWCLKWCRSCTSLLRWREQKQRCQCHLWLWALDCNCKNDFVATKFGKQVPLKGICALC